MTPDLAWGILIGALGIVGLEAVIFVVLLIAAVRRKVREQKAAGVQKVNTGGLRVVDAD